MIKFPWWLIQNDNGDYSLSFTFSSIFDKIREYLRKRKLRKKILGRLQNARRTKE